MEHINQMMLQYPQLLYAGAGATAVVTGGALVYKALNR